MEDRYRGRAFGALGTTQALLMFVGAMVGGLLGDVVGIVAVLVAQGSAYVLAGLLVLLLLGNSVAVAKKADSQHRGTSIHGDEGRS